MSENKTKPTGASVTDFIASVEPAGRRDDAGVLLDLMARATGLEPEMWGPSIVGYGRCHYRYDSGREGDWILTGFSPRKAAMSVYIMPGFAPYADLLTRLGKHKTGVCCLYLGRLNKVDLGVLETIVADSVARMRDRHRD